MTEPTTMELVEGVIQSTVMTQFQLDRANEAIARVRELHKKDVCDCLNDNCTDDWCLECDDFYPCKTIKALDGEQ